MDLSEILQLPRKELDRLTKAVIVAAILEEQRIDASLPIEQDEFGNPVYQLQRTLSGDGSLFSKREIRWTYHDAEKGVVNEIIIEGAKEVATVKHTLDGKQPTLKRAAIMQETPEAIKEV